MKSILLLMLCFVPLCTQAQPLKIKATKPVASGRYLRPPLKVSHMPKIPPQLDVRRGVAADPNFTHPYVPTLEAKALKAIAEQTALSQNLELQKKAIQDNIARITGGIDLLTYRNDLLKSYHLTPRYVEGFYTFRVYHWLEKPSWLPDAASTQVLFRGMLLTPEELNTVLRQGFSPKTSTWNAGTDGRDAVSFSSNIKEAESYIFQHGHKKDGIGVVFTVKRTPQMVLGKDPQLNSTKTIYYSYEDVPAQDIVEVSIRGEYGLSDLSKILQKAKEGTLPANDWVHQFDNSVRGFFR